MSASHTADYDVIAVGAGFAGISLSYHLREAGYSVKVFDRADEIGGTWAWNRYPAPRQTVNPIITASLSLRKSCRSGPGQNDTLAGKRRRPI